MVWLRQVLILFFLVPGCAVRHRVITTGAEIHRELPNLLKTGEARVMAKDRTSKRQKKVQVTVRRDQKVVVDSTRVALSELVRGCPIVPRFDVDGNPIERCGLLDYRYRPIELRMYEKRSVADFASRALAATLVGSFLGAGICTLACDGDSTVQDASLITFATIGIGGLAWMFISCSGRWGQPGCRD